MTARRILLSSLVSAGLLAGTGEAADRLSPEALVQARCGSCHGRTLPDLVESCAQRRGAEGLDAFLARHHAGDPQERAIIVAHLRARAAGEPPAPSGR